MKKRKKTPKIRVVILILELVALVALLLYFGKTKIEKTIVHKTTDQVIETIVTDQARKMGASDAEVQQVLNQITEDDKQVVEEIVLNHFDSDTIDKGTEYVLSGDVEGLKQYASQTLSPEETQELMNLYEKYKDSIE